MKEKVKVRTSRKCGRVSSVFSKVKKGITKKSPKGLASKQKKRSSQNSSTPSDATQPPLRENRSSPEKTKNRVAFSGLPLKQWVASTQGGKAHATADHLTVFIRNLAYEADNEDLTELIRDVVTPLRVIIIRDKDGKSRGFGFAHFRSEDEVDKVVRKLRGVTFHGRPLQLEKGFDREVSEADRKMMIAEKRMMRTGLVAQAFNQLISDHTVSVSFLPSLKLTPFRVAVFVSCLLPTSIKVVKVYGDAKTATWFLEFPGAREAASVAVGLNNTSLPVNALLRFFKDDERPSEQDLKGSETVVMNVNCLVSPIGKVAAASLTETNGSSDGKDAKVIKNPAPLIIRNLSFQASEQQLFHILKPFGLIRKLRLAPPKNLTSAAASDGSPGQAASIPTAHGGYAFVHYKTLENAQKAMQELNGKVFFGRSLTVDWGIDQKAYKDLKEGLIPIPAPNLDLLARVNDERRRRRGTGTDSYAESSDSEDDSPDGDAMAFDDEECEARLAHEVSTAEACARTVLLEAQTSLATSSLTDALSAQKRQDTAKNEDMEMSFNLCTPSSPLSLNGVEAGSTSQSHVSTPDGDEKAENTASKPATLVKDDVAEGRTLHIRNIAFDATPDEVKAAFAPYGAVVYVRLVKDPQGHFKGTAFVKFRTTEAVEKVLAEEQRVEQHLRVVARKSLGVPLDGLGISIKGRTVRVSQAVSRDVAPQLKLLKDETDKPRKNAHLATVGYIDPSGVDLQGMSKSDMLRRSAAHKEDMAKLNTPHYVVNPTRLCIRNIAPSVSTVDLRRAVMDFMISNAETQRLLLNEGAALNEKKNASQRIFRRLAEKELQHVTLCLNDATPGCSTARRSKGFGFLTFRSQEVARLVLMHLNNNPSVFGSDARRPIVSFAIEDRRALKHHEVMAQKHQEHKREALETHGKLIGSKKRKTYSRGRIQREKKRQQRAIAAAAETEDTSMPLVAT